MTDDSHILLADNFDRSQWKTDLTPDWGSGERRLIVGRPG